MKPRPTNFSPPSWSSSPGLFPWASPKRHFRDCTTRTDRVRVFRLYSNTTSQPTKSPKYWWQDSHSLDRTSKPRTSGRIHILGTGSIGCLLAHSLANLPADRRPPITLLLHREGLWEDFREKVCKIRVSKPFASKSDHDGTAGFDVEVQSSSEGGKWDHKHTASHNLPEDTQIDCLIVTVKGAMTVDALRSVRGRLKGPGSTVLLMQNGMGQRDELDAEIFRDPSTRPKYMQGIISHGAYLTDPFTATHAGNGDIQLGMLSDTPSLAPASAGLIRALGREEIENNLWSESARHLAGSLMESDLNCSLRTCAEVLTTQLLKLAVNATNNTLTALLDIINGHQLSNPIISGDIFPALISEISQILLSLPEVSDAVIGPHSRARFERHNLERFIRDMIKVNKTNSSSTREDMRRKKETELRYINGFLVKRGNELGKDVKLNELLLWLVQAKTLEVQGKVQQVD